MLDMLLNKPTCEQYHRQILEELKKTDEELYKLIEKEYQRLQDTIQLIAAENQCSKAVLAALGSIVQNKTTEGFPGARFHGGSEVVDDIENLATERAKKAFNAKYANLQPHSGTAANQIVLTAVLERDDKILSLGLDQGGHLSHGAKVSFSGKFFNVQNYYVDRKTSLLDYDCIREKALRFRPKLIICGATAYARTINFEKFREIADEANAYLLADISHISSLVMAGAHPSPVDYAHFTTTSTYKPGGPRGGAIIMGKDFDSQMNVNGKNMPLWELIKKTTFPGVQGTPYLNNIAAKAVFFKEAQTEKYKARQFRVIENAKSLAENLMKFGFDVLTNGTDNHMVLVNASNFKKDLTGIIAQKSLEDCGIVVNMNKLPYDDKPASITRGMRLGTPIVTRNGMGQNEMFQIAELISKILKEVQISGSTKYHLNDLFTKARRQDVKQLRSRFPIH